jgi:hypothetical protein
MFTKIDFFNVDETEEEFSTRLANNLESLIIKEGPETVSLFFCTHEGSYARCWYTVPEVTPPLLFSDCCLHC